MIRASVSIVYRRRKCSARSTGRQIRLCLWHQYSPVCGSRAASALEVLIRGFVRCLPQARYSDRSISAFCFTNASSMSQPPIDLGARLIEEGLALAGPAAPFEYQALERIARANRRGVWGFQVDQVIR